MRPLLVAALLVSACAPRLEPLPLPEGCQPLLGGAHCLLPYPSDYFLVDDAAMPSGKRVAVTSAARPRTDQGGNADLGAWRAIDGASRLPMPTAYFPADVSATPLTGLFDDPAATLRPDSASLLIDTRTGALVPHFVDLDPRAASAERQALVLHPLAMLDEKTRYVVAFQRVTSPGGFAVPAPEGFRRLRDGLAAGDPVLEPLAARFESDVFPALAKAGVSRQAVQLAWDFTTGSDARTAGDLLRVRELTLAWLASNTPAVTLTQVEPLAEADLWRRVRGTVEVPRFVASTAPGAALVRDAAGQVAQAGTMSVPFLAQVPLVLRDEPGPATTLVYGHGAFSTRDEALSPNPRDIARHARAVLFAIDWWGMSRVDVASTLDAVSRKPTHALAFSDGVAQGMANHLVLSAAIAGPLLALPEFQDASGAPLYPPEATRFLGISQGHVLGGVLAAVHPGLTHVGLNAGGGGLSHALARSRPLSDIFLVLDLADPLERRALESTLQPYFDRIDGAFWGKYVLEAPLPGSAPRKVLMQVGLGDPEVPNVASFIHARALGLKQLAPVTHPVFGVGEVASPTTSALVLYDFGLDLRVIYGPARPSPDGNVVHEETRRLPPALEQLGAFFGARDELVQFCAGPCDPD